MDGGHASLAEPIMDEHSEDAGQLKFGSALGRKDGKLLKRRSSLFDMVQDMPKDHVKSVASDLPPEEANGLLTHVQSLSEHFKGFSEDELQQLGDHVTVMRFEEKDVVVQEGDEGTWFGVLLEGSVSVDAHGTTIVRSVRTATTHWQ